MKIEIGDKQLKKIENILQRLIDSQLDSLKEMSMDFGLGEMDEYHEINSVDKILINKLVLGKKIKVYVNLYINNEYPDRNEYGNLISELEYNVSEFFPIELFIQNVTDNNE